MVEERAKALETIKRLRERADHPDTPKEEAETCRRMADKLALKHGISESQIKEQPAPPVATRSKRRGEWNDDRVRIQRAEARREAELRRPDFEEGLWFAFYDRAVAMQHATEMLFDPELAFETSWERYAKAKAVDDRLAGATWTNSSGREIKLAAMSDLEIGIECDRESRIVIQLRDSIAGLRRATERPGLVSAFVNPPNRTQLAMLEQDRRSLKQAEKRLALFRAELDRRSVAS